MKQMWEMQAIVKGHVQGVGFRATTQYIAAKLGLLGKVSNKNNGSVEIIALGDKAKLEELLDMLQNDFFQGRITSIEKQFKEASEHDYESFDVE